MPAVPLVLRRCAALTATLAVLLAAGCSQKPAPLQALPAPSATQDSVPDVIGMQYKKVDGIMQARLLVPFLRFAPELTTNAGTVVALEPPAGTVAKPGDVVVVVVAGPNPNTYGEGTQGALAISQLAQLDQKTFVGVGWDWSDDSIVLALAPGVDLESWRARITALARGEKFRLQSCLYSHAELRKLQVQLSERDFLPRAKQMTFSINIDPVSCSVQLAGAFTPAEVTQLQERYGGALNVLTGKAPRPKGA